MNQNEQQGRPNHKAIKFSNTLRIALSLLGACFALFYAFLGHYTPADKKAYDALVKGETVADKSEIQVSKQRRNGMQKNFFFNDHHQRLEFKLRSTSSELALEKTDRHIEVVEHLQDVACWLQESVYFILSDGRQAFQHVDGWLLIKGGDPEDKASLISMDTPGLCKEQVILVLKAEHATYHYEGELFVANNVEVLRYITPTHDLGEIPSRSKQGVMMAIAADHADFKDEVVTLTGHAVVEHEIGNLYADKMVLESRSKAKNLSFDLLQMDGHVDISLDGAGRLLCSKAIVDYETYTGVFVSGESQERVVYSEVCKEKEGSNTPLLIKSSGMKVNLVKAPFKQENSEKAVIGAITAEGDVAISYASHFTATADRAIFRRDQAAAEQGKMPGTVILSCLPDRQCHVISDQGDEIRSHEILIDTTHKELTFINPKGSLKNLANPSIPLDFTAQKLVWNDLTSKLILSEDVEIFQEGFGKLQATQDVRLVLSTHNGKKVPRAMETCGEALLTYVDSDTRFDHTLRSYGSLRIDHQKMELKLQSPEKGDGSSIEGQQIFFKDAKGEIYADKAFVKYDYVDQKIVPVRIILQGNVKITNNLELSAEDKTPAEQYILADRVDFIPHTKEMIFKASKGHRVLLYDKANNLEVSAPGLKFIRDVATRKETVKGIGDVRFSFVEAEFNQLRRHFCFDKMMPAQKTSAENE